MKWVPISSAALSATSNLPPLAVNTDNKKDLSKKPKKVRIQSECVSDTTANTKYNERHLVEMGEPFLVNLQLFEDLKTS